MKMMNLIKRTHKENKRDNGDGHYRLVCNTVLPNEVSKKELIGREGKAKTGIEP